AAHDNTSEIGSAAGWIVLIAVGMTVVLTASYCTRAWLVLTHLSPQEAVVHEAAVKDSREVEVGLVEIFTEPAPGAGVTPDSSGGSAATVVEAQVEPDHGHADIHLSARLSVWVLALLSVVGGLIIFTPLVPHIEPHINWWLAGSSLALIVASFAAVRRMALGQDSGDAADRLGAERMALFDRGLGADGVYVAMASQVVRLADIVVIADRQVIDAYVRGTVVVTRWIGTVGERAHTRKPSSYLVWLLVGLLAVGVTGVTLW
ncbi:MAG: hypothetical protein ABI474_06185, partial [Actinomycetota bacterium]